MSKREQIRQEIATLESRVAELKAQDAEFENDFVLVATELHEAICKSNHAEGCSWHYEKSWREGVKGKYYEAAKQLLEHADLNTILSIIETLKGL